MTKQQFLTNWPAVEKIIAGLAVVPKQQAEVANVCRCAMLDVFTHDDFLFYLSFYTSLNEDEVFKVYDQLYDNAWDKLWSQSVGGSQPGLNDKFKQWQQVMEVMTALAEEEITTKGSLALALESYLQDADNPWPAYLVLKKLAAEGRLLSVAMQSRTIRDGFNKWATTALVSRGNSSANFIPPSLDNWNVPWLALLLEYLLIVCLGWQGEEAAMAAMVLGQNLARASGQHEYATIVYADEHRGEFLWRPVRVEGDKVAWGN